MKYVKFLEEEIKYLRLIIAWHELSRRFGEKGYDEELRIFEQISNKIKSL